jgi:hypothetical protein
MLNCEACGASHVVQPPIGEMSKSMRFGRLAEAKRLGHEAAAQAETVHLATWPSTRSLLPSFSRRIHDAHFSPACLAKLQRLKSLAMGVVDFSIIPTLKWMGEDGLIRT